MSSFILADYKWNWIDDGLLPYALAIMRATWIGLLVHLWSRGTMPYRPDLVTPLMVFGLLAASTACVQFGAYLIRTTWRAVLLVVLGGLGGIALTLYLGLGTDRPVIWELRWFTLLTRDPVTTILTLLIAVWLWWWGIRTGCGRVYYDLLTANFTCGILMLALGAVVVYATRVIPLLHVLLAFIVFFVIGLGTMAIANLQSTRHFEGSRSDQVLPVNRYWLGTVVVVIGAVLLVGLLVGQLFTFGPLTWVLAKLAILWEWLAWLLLRVFVPVSYALFKLFEWITRLVHLGGNPTDQLLPKAPASFAEQFKDLQPGHPSIPPQVYVGLQALAGILVVAVIVFIFVLAFRRFKTLLEEDVEETREIIFSMDLLRKQLAQLFGRKNKGNSTVPEAFVAVLGDDPRAQIRRTYQALLAWAAERGVARRPGQTPGEHMLLMNHALPAYAEPISIITAAYVQARYGIDSIRVADAEHVRQAWEHIAQRQDAS